MREHQLEFPFPRPYAREPCPPQEVRRLPYVAVCPFCSGLHLKAEDFNICRGTFDPHNR
jgi:hypothetical protein